MRPVYLVSERVWTPSDGGSDVKGIVSPVAARRLGPMLKRALRLSVDALEDAGIKVPDAVVCATDWGCIVNSDAYLSALRKGDIPSPTHFMMSTHNTVSSLIAITLGAKGYNATYSHRGASAQSALLDAWMQISLGEVDTALVGVFDERLPDAVFAEGTNPTADIGAVYVLSSHGDSHGDKDLKISDLCGGLFPLR